MWSCYLLNFFFFFFFCLFLYSREATVQLQILLNNLDVAIISWKTIYIILYWYFLLFWKKTYIIS